MRSVLPLGMNAICFLVSPRGEDPAQPAFGGEKILSLVSSELPSRVEPTCSSQSAFDSHFLALSESGKVCRVSPCIAQIRSLQQVYSWGSATNGRLGPNSKQPEFPRVVEGLPLDSKIVQARLCFLSVA